MALLPPLINPTLTTQISALQFDSTITIQSLGSSVNSFGEVDRSDANWNDVSGLTGLAALIQPFSTSGSVTESRKADLTAAVAAYKITLNGYFPDVQPFMRAVDQDGVHYNILGVQSRSLTLTVLKAEVVIPGAAI